MKLSENLTKKEKTLYQRIAEKYEVSSDYVGFIARGERRGIRGKGAAIRAELEAMAQNNETQNQ